MNAAEESDVVNALRQLEAREPSPDRSRALVGQAMRTIARRRRLAERRVVATAAMYAAMVAPFAAGSLAAGYLAAAIIQAVIVFRYTPAGLF